MLGIVAAFKDEAREYLKRGRFRLAKRSGPFRFYLARKGPPAALVLGAVGKLGAIEATRKLVEDYSPQFVVSAGFAGAVRPDLRAGDVFLCDRVLSLEGPPAFWAADNASERLVPYTANGHANGGSGHNGHANGNGRAKTVGCVTVPQFVHGSPMKAWLGRVLPVSVIDMESYWVSETASAYDTPHAVVRAVLDTIDDPMPEFLDAAMRLNSGSPRLRAMRYAMGHPLRVRRLMRLASRVKLARRSLADCLEAQPWN